jgi:hypothetical protein
MCLPYYLSYSIPPCDKTILTYKTISWRIVRGGDFVLDHGLIFVSALASQLESRNHGVEMDSQVI